MTPLNRWFYDAQGLITIRNGGHLWGPALACCVIYAGVMRLLRHPLFVSTFVASIAMTGLLIFDDQGVNRFWEVLALSMFLVVLGSLAVHAERLSPVATAGLSRERFGLAFLRAGHVVMAVGWVGLLIGRLARWFDLSVLQSLAMVDLSWLVRPSVVELGHQKMLAMLLVLGANYTFGFSQFVVGRHSAAGLVAACGQRCLRERPLQCADVSGIPHASTIRDHPAHRRRRGRGGAGDQRAGGPLVLGAGRDRGCLGRLRDPGERSSPLVARGRQQARPTGRL